MSWAPNGHQMGTKPSTKINLILAPNITEKLSIQYISIAPFSEIIQFNFENIQAPLLAVLLNRLVKSKGFPVYFERKFNSQDF